jgi:hypothetical protein
MQYSDTLCTKNEVRRVIALPKEDRPCVPLRSLSSSSARRRASSSSARLRASSISAKRRASSSARRRASSSASRRASASSLEKTKHPQVSRSRVAGLPSPCPKTPRSHTTSTPPPASPVAHEQRDDLPSFQSCWCWRSSKAKPCPSLPPPLPSPLPEPIPSPRLAGTCASAECYQPIAQGKRGGVRCVTCTNVDSVAGVVPC